MGARHVYNIKHMLSDVVPLLINLCSCPAEISTVVCGADKVASIIKQAEFCSELKTIIKMGDKISDEEEQEASRAGLQIYSMTQIEVCYLYCW